MKLHELRSPDGSRQRRKRVGRGTGSGHGKTSGRGQKGQGARSQGFRLGFEGGQMPLAQRLPKLGGFINPFKKQFAIVNLSRLSQFADGDEVTPERLYTEGLAEDGVMVKILGAGKLRRKLTVTAHAVSESARRAIEARGGTVTVLLEKPAPKASPAAEPAPPPSASGDADTSPTNGEETPVQASDQASEGSEDDTEDASATQEEDEPAEEG